MSEEILPLLQPFTFYLIANTIGQLPDNWAAAGYSMLQLNMHTLQALQQLF